MVAAPWSGKPPRRDEAPWAHKPPGIDENVELGRDSSSAAAKMKVVRVRAVEGEEKLTISLGVGGRQRNLFRPAQEELAKPLGKIQQSAQGKKPKVTKNKSESVLSPALEVALWDTQGVEVSRSTSNWNAWCDGCELKVGEETFVVHRNLPTCSVALHGRPMKGIPLLPLLESEFANFFRWKWFREANGRWEDVQCSTRNFTPSLADVGRKIRVECWPCQEWKDGFREGASAVAVVGPVEPAPPKLPSDGRRNLTAEYSKSPNVRIMSYNVLANMYAAAEYGKTVIFTHVPQAWMDIDYRKQIALKEVLDFKCDVVCLQEVDVSVYQKFWEPSMQYEGYLGSFTKKPGDVNEGQAIFLRNARYTFKDVRPLIVRELFTKPVSGHLSQISGLLEELPNIQHALEKIPTVATIAVLQPTNGSGQPLLVVNTHLYFHPGASNIRTLQIYAILKEVEKYLDVWSGGPKPAVFLCGDLNSEPDTSAIELLQRGKVSAGHYEWNDSARFVSPKLKKGSAVQPNDYEAHEAPSFTGADLENPFDLASADRLLTPFTNFVMGYIATLDYIFYDTTKFGLEFWVPTPSVEDVREYNGTLPSVRYPSDHISIIAEFTTDSKNNAGKQEGQNEKRRTMPLPANRYNVAKAAEAIKNEGVVAIPTDTIYGLAAAAKSSVGIKKLYAIKGRDAKVPLSICVADLEDIGTYGNVSLLPEGLLQELLPGPYTIILNQLDNAPLASEINRESSTIGLRIPDCEFVRDVARAAGGALALTSANESGEPSTVDVWEFQKMWDQCDNVFSSLVPLEQGRAGSTVVDLSEAGTFKVVRDGSALDAALATIARFGLVRRTE